MFRRLFPDVETPVKKPVQETVNPEHFGDRLQTVTLNGKSYPGLEEEVLACIAYVENFSDTAYFAVPNGQSATVQPPIPTAAAFRPDNASRANMPSNAYVGTYAVMCFRSLKLLWKNNFRKTEMIATCLFVYNIGGGNFTNRKGMGPCAFERPQQQRIRRRMCTQNDRMSLCRRQCCGGIAEKTLGRRRNFAAT